MAEALQARGSVGLTRRSSLPGHGPRGSGDDRGAGRGASGSNPIDEGRRRRSARLTIWTLVVIVLGLYFGYIAYALVAGFHARRAPHGAAPAAGTTQAAAPAPSAPRR